MKDKYIPIAIIIIFLSFTNVISNTWRLLTDQDNYIPKESNILFFKPIKIDSGSGGYWEYGEDYNNYYYYSLYEENVYFYIKKNNDCDNFNKIDFKTWCNAIKRIHHK
ncbi:hypothetical protein HYE59_08215 [Aggregatibacter actinomycetemcomitans]|uniref:hypothetical protein n=2 Tax=Aggregatibacter actinomycetemcomitans TaxID=714 RepID=UPI00197B5486|nr:hypothetical protein [Aggregatibacter actinomycetemcomitans]MBN6077512.1 hypothetical protein [Aggregatibacter actinomycetemcomitans]